MSEEHVSAGDLALPPLLLDINSKKPSLMKQKYDIPFLVKGMQAQGLWMEIKKNMKKLLVVIVTEQN